MLAVGMPDIKIVVANRGGCLSKSTCFSTNVDESEPTSQTEIAQVDDVPGTDDFDENADLEEGELHDLIEEDMKFIRFVGYDADAEDLIDWAGAEYAERRADL